LAKEVGIDSLNELHWKVIEFSRTDFAEKGEAPSLRRITQAGGVSTKELYQLFPKGPAKKVAKIAGLGKPTGCI
jgi:tRNA 2-thiouridine synthesizing protein E